MAEKTSAIFFKANFESEIAGMPFRLSAGVRNEGTRVLTVALGREVLALTRPLTDPSLLEATYSATQPIIARSHYNYLLPSIDAKREVTSNLILRLDPSTPRARSPGQPWPTCRRP